MLMKVPILPKLKCGVRTLTIKAITSATFYRKMEFMNSKII